jgi:hypothetical protein
LFEKTMKAQVIWRCLKPGIPKTLGFNMLFNTKMVQWLGWFGGNYPYFRKSPYSSPWPWISTSYNTTTTTIHKSDARRF